MDTPLINHHESEGSYEHRKHEHFHPTYREEGYRWVIVILFILYTLANAAYTVAFAPISDLVSATYDISLSDVNLVYASTAAGYLILAIPTNWLLENKGVHLTINISAIFFFVGIWLRIFVN